MLWEVDWLQTAGKVKPMSTETTNQMLDTIRDDIRKALKRQKVTQRSVAKLMGISPVHLCNFLSGRNSMQIETLLNLLHILGLRLVVMRIPK